MIRLEKVSKRFGEKPIFSDVSFSVGKGEFVFLVGASGVGKTTLLRMLFADLHPDHGKVFVDGMEVNRLPQSGIPQLRRKIGIVFQDFKMLYEQTIFENVALSLEIAGKKEAEIRKKAAEVLDLVGLKGRDHHFPAQMSAGELQRVTIARAIVGGPQVLLADEPTGNLDPKTSADITNILSEINKLGTTVVMATHDKSVVDTMKRRVLTLAEGKITRDHKGTYS